MKELVSLKQVSEAMLSPKRLRGASAILMKVQKLSQRGSLSTPEPHNLKHAQGVGVRGILREIRFPLA